MATIAFEGVTPIVRNLYPSGWAYKKVVFKLKCKLWILAQTRKVVLIEADRAVLI